MINETYTTPEVAELLGMKRRSVTRLIMRGNLRAERRGRDYFVSHEELERFKQERRVSGRPAKEQTNEV